MSIFTKPKTPQAPASPATTPNSTESSAPAPAFDVTKLTPAEAMNRAIADAQFVACHKAKIEARRAELLDLLMQDPNHQDTTLVELANIDGQANYADGAVNAARKRLRALSSRIVTQLTILMEELRYLHADAYNLTSAHVHGKIDKALGGLGWWTTRDINVLAAQSLPMCEQHRFEHKYPAIIGVGLISAFNVETQVRTDELNDEAISEPGRIVDAHTTLTRSIEAAKKRVEDLRARYSTA